MANGISSILSVSNDERKLLSKGKNWDMNMYIDNDYYWCNVQGNDISKLITTLKNTGNIVYLIKLTDYASDKGIVNVGETYWLNDKQAYCCFIQNTANKMKLMTVNSRLPAEFAKIGHNSVNKCIVPVIVVKDGDGFNAININ